jgi:hypothetical protein
MSFAVITLCVASQRVFIIIVVCFVIYSVRKLLDTPLQMEVSCQFHAPAALPSVPIG